MAQGARGMVRHNLSGRASGLSGADQHPFGFWRAVKAGLGNQLGIFKADPLKHGQEILSRYGSALSAGPAFYDLLLFFFWQFTD